MNVVAKKQGGGTSAREHRPWWGRHMQRLDPFWRVIRCSRPAAAQKAGDELRNIIMGFTYPPAGSSRKVCSKLVLVKL
jgi:hypothetical protein